MTSRIHPHSPLPAPAMRASTPSVQSKSHVLAGVQDAYWSDDEAEDAECPLCLEEMDISDVNFKPCPCGYQICRFCWHHIKENLNGRCPACRREYTDDAVQFKPINKEDHKRLTQQKKQRERERKELDALGRKHLANVRVVQRNVVYVVGIGPRFAKEELIPTLRSHEYFGQYGKISKIVIVKRTAPGSRTPVVGLYITFHRREDAARCIAAVDGAPSPGASGEVMRASYGTTKYCMAFLRGVSCSDHSCMNLHEWGDENDCFTKEDLTTLKHTMKDTETRARTVTIIKKGEDAEGLPRAASWANKPPATVASTALQNHTNAMQSSAARQQRRTATPATRQQRSGSITASSTSGPAATAKDRKASAAAKGSSSLASSSRPATPSPAPAATTKASKQKEPAAPAAPPAVRSPSPVPPEPESKPEVEQISRASSPPESEALSPEPVAAIPAAPPGLPAVPPGLSAPPGLPPPSHTPISTDSSPQIPMQISQGPYQMSSQAQALMADLKARREGTQVATGPSPFPELDRMMQSLAGDNSFSFNLDPKLAADSEDVNLNLPDFQAEPSQPFNGTFFDAFPGVRQPPPPGLGFPHLGGSRERISTPSSSYSGSFNPFADSAEDAPRQFSPLDEERKVSRFGFARRQGSSASTSASSPLHASTSLSHSESFSQSAYFPASEMPSPASHAGSQWNYTQRHHDYLHQPASAMSSPLAQHAQAHNPYAQQQQQQQSARYQQQYDTSVSEAQLRDFINSSRDRTMRTGSADPHNNYTKFSSNQPFSDPAIMSARLASPVMAQPMHDSYANLQLESYQQQQQLAYGPPPGLAYPPGIIPGPSMARHGLGVGSGPSNIDLSQGAGSAHVSSSPSPIPSPALSSSDFPALPAAESSDQQRADSSEPTTPSTEKGQSKAARAAAAKKKASDGAAAKAAAKAAEKERLAEQKAAKEKAAALQKAAEKEKAAREKAEREEKERLEKEKAERQKAERAERAERERAAAAAAATSAKAAKAAATPKPNKVTESANISRASTPTQASKPSSRRNTTAKQPAPPVNPSVDPIVQAPILAKMPKKNKPNTKPIKIPKEDLNDVPSAMASAATSEAPQLPEVRNESSSVNSRAHSEDRTTYEPRSLQELLAEIDMQVPWMHLAQHPFFDMSKINPASKLPLEYGPLVHALSALSVGGGSFANTMPSGSIDNAVSSFQQLLETLTQTISDLLRLLPRTTWDDSSSFDGVLRDMLKGDDFLEDGGEEPAPQGKEDEVAALTMALERRARWMEVQLSKLEELHRDINNAAVRAVLSFNDNGWDLRGFMPRMGDTLARFEHLGKVLEGDVTRNMSADELEQELALAKESVVSAEAELRDVMQSMQAVKPLDDEVY